MDFSLRVKPIAVRAAGLLAVLGIMIAGTSCGDTYRPIAIPEQPTPPSPAALHYVISLSSNGVCPVQSTGQVCAAGASSKIDVAGDTAVGAAVVGLSPVHATVSPNGATVFVADQMENTISYYSPSQVTPVSSISLPSDAAPDFVTATDNVSLYVANAGNNTVSDVSTSNEEVVRTSSVGPTPVALAELPNASKVYVANHGTGASPVNGSVQSISGLDGSVAPIGNSSWKAPVWMVARNDSNRVFALDQGTGFVSAIDTAADAVVGTANVQPGANFIAYDANLSRLYVTNPVARTLTVLNATSDSLALIGSVSFGAASAACPSGCTPLSVSPLPDGSRVYVASYQTAGSCSQAGDTPPCVSAQITVITATNLSVNKTIPITLTNSSGTKSDTPDLAVCDTTRFRIFTAAAADSTRVYMSYCDAGATAIIRTTPNTSPGSENTQDYLVTSLNAPVSANSAPVAGAQPPPQNPVFVIPGP